MDPIRDVLDVMVSCFYQKYIANYAQACLHDLGCDLFEIAVAPNSVAKYVT